MADDGAPKSGSVFRDAALREYMEGRQDSVLPAFTRGYFTTALWVLALMAMGAAVLVLTLVSVTTYRSDVAFVHEVDGGTLLAVPAVADGLDAGAVQRMVITHDAADAPLIVDLSAETGRHQDIDAIRPVAGSDAEFVMAAAALGDDVLVYTVGEDSGAAAAPAGVYPAQVSAGSAALWEVVAGLVTEEGQRQATGTGSEFAQGTVVRP